MFFFQGTRDRLVPSVTPKAMVKALKEKDVEAEIYLIEGAGHIGAAMNGKALDRAFDFLKEHLNSPLKKGV